MRQSSARVWVSRDFHYNNSSITANVALLLRLRRIITRLLKAFEKELNHLCNKIVRFRYGSRDLTSLTNSPAASAYCDPSLAIGTSDGLAYVGAPSKHVVLANDREKLDNSPGKLRYSEEDTRRTKKFKLARQKLNAKQPVTGGMSAYGDDAERALELT